jgi:outer membrane protein OmpA-like peptidoglycan-associated protein
VARSPASAAPAAAEPADEAAAPPPSAASTPQGRPRSGNSNIVEEPPQETPLTSPTVRMVPQPETPREPPPPPRGSPAARPLPGTTQQAALSPPPIAPREMPLLQVNFPANSAALSASERSMLRQVVPLQKQSDGTIRVVGYAGSDESGAGGQQKVQGLGIALDRANALAAALVDAGIDKSRILVEAAPVQPNSGPGARRAEIFMER